MHITGKKCMHWGVEFDRSRVSGAPEITQYSCFNLLFLNFPKDSDFSSFDFLDQNSSHSTLRLEFNARALEIAPQRDRHAFHSFISLKTTIMLNLRLLFKSAPKFKKQLGIWALWMGVPWSCRIVLSCTASRVGSDQCVGLCTSVYHEKYRRMKNSDL